MCLVNWLLRLIFRRRQVPVDLPSSFHIHIKG